MQIKKLSLLLSIFISFTLALIVLCSQLAYADESSLNLHYTTSTELKAYSNTAAINSTQTVYIVNKAAGKYLHSTDTVANLDSGSISSLGQSIQWQLTQLEDGTYTIQSLSNPSLYLAAASASSSTRIFLIALNDGTITDRYKWNFTIASGGGVLIQNVNTQKFLKHWGDSLTSRATVDNSSTIEYNSFVWLYTTADYYGNTSTHAKVELPIDFSFNTCTLFSDETASPELNSKHSNVLWASPDFFTYSGFDTDYVTFDTETHTFTAQSYEQNYSVTITATHKLSERESQFTLVVNPKAIALGIPDINHDHQSAFNVIDDIIIEAGYSDVTKEIGEYMDIEALDFLDDNEYDLFISRSHGDIITSGSKEIATAILLTSSSSENLYYLDSRYLPLYDLTNMKMILFVGCYTAADIGDGKNLPEAAIEAGAKTAIGFDSSIVCSEANNWTITLFEYLDDGLSLQAAINQMISEEEMAIEEFGELEEGASYITISDLVVIYGIKKQYLH